jgi:hypothetical protein
MNNGATLMKTNKTPAEIRAMWAQRATQYAMRGRQVPLYILRQIAKAETAMAQAAIAGK